MKRTSIKVENNLKDILYYLEAKGCEWRTGFSPTKHIPKVDHGLNYVNIGNNYELSHSCDPSCETVITLDEFKTKYPITKYDLKPGMVIQYNDGSVRLVVPVNDELFLLGNDAYNSLNAYSIDLTDPVSPDLNIDKVYLTSKMHALKYILDDTVCVWTRSVTTEVTMDEIARKFGIPVNQLKIKK